MKKIIETQYLSIPAVRGLCIENNLYTRGTNEEYAAMFDMVHPLDGKSVITAEDLYPIAADILAHSNTDQDVASIMYCLGRRIDRCYTVEEVPDKYVVTCECTDDGPEYMLYHDGKKHRENEIIVASFETYEEAVACKRGLIFCEGWETP